MYLIPTSLPSGFLIVKRCLLSAIVLLFAVAQPIAADDGGHDYRGLENRENRSNRFDGKGYFGLNFGATGFDYEFEGSKAIDDTGDFTSLMLGFDVAHRVTIEINFNDFGEYEFEGTSDDADVRGIGVSGLFYLFGSQGNRGVSDRTGLNGYLRAGGIRIDEFSIFSDDVGVEGDYFTAGFGLEYGFQSVVFLRGEIEAIGDLMARASVSVAWRWGRR